MIQPIMKDIFFLQQKSEPATQLDAGRSGFAGHFSANAHACVGMANMIGVKSGLSSSTWASPT